MGKRTKADEDDLAATREAPALLPGLPLLGAGEAVIAEKGFAGATAEEIAARAGVSADVFYAHFRGKSALLRALCDRWIEQMSAVTRDATRSGIWDGATPVEIIDVAARSAIDAIYDHAALVRAILSQGHEDPELFASLKKVGALLTRRVVEILREQKPKRGAAAVDDRAVAFCLLTAIALAHHAVLVGADSTGVPLGRDEVATEASKAISAYLGVRTKRSKRARRGNNRSASRV